MSPFNKDQKVWWVYDTEDPIECKVDNPAVSDDPRPNAPKDGCLVAHPRDDSSTPYYDFAYYADLCATEADAYRLLYKRLNEERDELLAELSGLNSRIGLLIDKRIELAYKQPMTGENANG